MASNYYLPKYLTIIFHFPWLYFINLIWSCTKMQISSKYLLFISVQVKLVALICAGACCNFAYLANYFYSSVIIRTWFNLFQELDWKTFWVNSCSVQCCSSTACTGLQTMAWAWHCSIYLHSHVFLYCPHHSKFCQCITSAQKVIISSSIFGKKWLIWSSRIFHL